MNTPALCLLLAAASFSHASAQQPATATSAADSTHAAAPVRNTPAWNLASKTRIAISGYDPVSYFPEGGGKPLKGNAKFEVFHMGARYMFANAANRDAFLKDTSKYEPSHGGWCSWAMREGDKVEVDPTSFIIKDGRLFLFYKGFLADTRSKWLAGDHKTEAGDADRNWKKLSGEEPPQASKPVAALAPSLNQVWEKASEKMGPEIAGNYAKGIETLRASGIEKGAMKVGDTAPPFELVDAGGKSHSLAAMRSNGPVVVTFVRGSWCPFCNVQMAAYQQMMPELKQLGASIVAITPQLPEQAMAMVEKGGLEFPMLFDRGNAAAKSFGIAFTMPEGSKMDLSKVNGDSSGMLPVPATYVIDTTGKIVYSFVEVDYRKRAEPVEILAAVRSAASAAAMGNEVSK